MRSMLDAEAGRRRRAAYAEARAELAKGAHPSADLPKRPQDGPWGPVVLLALERGLNAAGVRSALKASGCGPYEARAIADALRLGGHFRDTRGCRSVDGTTMLPPDAKPLPAERDPWVKRVRANVMHLVDLKRAGHSPRRTERRTNRGVAHG